MGQGFLEVCNGKAGEECWYRTVMAFWLSSPLWLYTADLRMQLTEDEMTSTPGIADRKETRRTSKTNDLWKTAKERLALITMYYSR
jgi:hypothetical protein